MRGSPGAMPWRASCHGIIPAHAGLTARPSAARCPSWDHPRACGAHNDLLAGNLPSQGSSPRMRGSLESLTCGDGYTGIIPAHAGLTPGPLQGMLGRWDHPRACGAHRPSSSPRRCSSGSSPRMRGSHRLLEYATVNLGIIPAHAGLTHYCCRPSSASRDHPRACGAHDGYIP